MLPLSTLNSVKERGSNGALRSHLFAKGQTRRGGSRRSFTEGGTLNHQLRHFDMISRYLSIQCLLPSVRRKRSAALRLVFHLLGGIETRRHTIVTSPQESMPKFRVLALILQAR